MDKPISTPFGCRTKLTKHILLCHYETLIVIAAIGGAAGRLPDGVRSSWHGCLWTWHDGRLPDGLPSAFPSCTA